MARLSRARGALAAEAVVLDRLEALLAEAAGDPALLARPVRVIVPSRSLRLHLAAALVRRRGRPAVGVTVQTLWGVALEVLERRWEAVRELERQGGGSVTGGRGAAAEFADPGFALPWGRHLAEVLARRLARSERDLAGPLDGLVDGYAAVAATARDLLDAGFEPAHAEAAEEALAADGPAVATGDQVRRAQALVRVAAGVAAAVEALGVRRTSTLFRRATALLVAAPDAALPARAVLVHGFADAPGVTLDFLEALVRHHSAEVVVDLPPDPAGEIDVTGDAASPADHPFAARFLERLAAAGGPSSAPRPAPDSSSPAAFVAAGLDAEVRELAVRLRALLDAGARPEGLGVVVRDLDRYRLPLRRHFDDLGVPFSAVGGGGSLTAAGRAAAALRDLLGRGDELPTERWLDAAGRGGPLAVDLRLAFSALGAARLRDVAGLEVDRFLRGGYYALPVRQGLREAAAGEDEDGDESGQTAGGDEGAALEPGRRRRRRGAAAPRRRIHGDVLRRAAAAARTLVRRLDEWPPTATSGEQFARLDGLLDLLGWPPADAVRDAIAAARDALPGDFPLGFDELRLLLDRSLGGEAGVAGIGTDPLGGRGGGVQVLTVVEARGRTFEHLFLPGLNRGVFPRTVRQDPLLGDDLRGVLARLIPDVPIKQRGFDEERYLFAQLLAAAPRVTLSWPLADREGRPLAASPLVERLAARLGFAVGGTGGIGGTGAKGPPRAPALTAPPVAAGPSTTAPALRPAREHAVLAALHGPRDRFGAILTAATREARAEAEANGASLAIDPDLLAAARLAALAELDPDRRTAAGRAAAGRLGPYFGFVGAAVRADDPRRGRDLYVTLFERLATCPWQVFLERVLGLEPTPDPLQALPGVSPLLVGNLVHRVLEEIARRALPDPAPASLDEARGAAPAPVPWPDPETLTAITAAAATRLVDDEGVALPGLARALAERALPFLDEARRADWDAGDAGDVAALAVEVEGAIEVPDAAGGAALPLRFKADRVDVADGRLRLTDYKTGKGISEGKKPETRHGHLLADVQSGRRLQAVAYALAGAAGAKATGAVGRYLFLKPEIPFREFAVDDGEGAFGAAFATAVAAGLGAWRTGAFVPRVVDPRGRKEPPACSYCAVAEACLRGDSGARRRLAEWTAGGEAEAPGASAAEAALLAVWRLPAAERDGEEGS